MTRLLERGANPDGGAASPEETPLGWAAHGSQHQHPGRDYVAVAELLVAAGNTIEPSFLDIAHGPLVAWLEERL